MDHDPDETAYVDRAAEVNAEHRPVTIDAEVVTRPSSPTSPAIHSLLRHLRARGATWAPEPLGIDGDTERLAWLAGDSGGDAWAHQHDDAGLASAARLLRAVHDASRGWEPPPDAVWSMPAVPGGPGEDLVWCHGDPGPWNMVWRDGEAVGLIDWDYLHLAPRLDDVAYALHWFIPLRSDEHALEWHHFPEVPDRRHRVSVFLDAYGDLPAFDVADAVTARMQRTVDLMTELADRGQEPQRTWVADGALEHEAAEIAWVREHRAEIT